MIRCIPWLILLAAAWPARCGDPCLPVTGERIQAQDLVAAVPEFSGAAPGMTFGYAPAPGAQRVLSAAELSRAAKAQGIELSAARAVCVERASTHLNANELETAMRGSLGTADATLEILEFSRHAVPVGEIAFPKEGLPATAPGGNGPVLWRGYVRYADKRRFPVWARVKIAVPANRFFAVGNLPAGVPIEPHQVRTEATRAYPGNRPALTLDRIAGRAPRHAVAAGEEIPFALEQPRLVAKGETVRVEVQAGSARLALDGRAETGGDAGQVIAVRNLQSGRVFSARVSGKGQAQVIEKERARWN